MRLALRGDDLAGVDARQKRMLLSTQTLPLTSSRACLPSHRANAARFSNVEMCRLTEQVGPLPCSASAADSAAPCAEARCTRPAMAAGCQAGLNSHDVFGFADQYQYVHLCNFQVIFTDPYYAAQYNRHTSPQASLAVVLPQT